MLQQTQVSRVVPAYGRFLRRFPTLRALARASLADVLREWSGLGYNRRARDLHRAARLAGGTLPRGVAELDALPGVGSYTASAVACFAHRAAVPFADTNIRRVLGRSLAGRTVSEREARELDRGLMSRRDAARWHHALMDVGALFCHARRPRCHACPLRTLCVYRGGDDHTPRTQTHFATSDRRIRGAIVRFLSEARAPVTVPILRKRIGDARVDRLLRDLVSDGLAQVSERGASLPTR